MEAVGLEDVAGEEGADIWGCATISHCMILELIPGVHGGLADLSFLCLGEEVEVAWLSHDVYASLSEVILCLFLDAACEGVHLLRLQIDLLADEVGVARRIVEARSVHIEQSVYFFDEFCTHRPWSQFS